MKKWALQAAELATPGKIIKNGSVVIQNKIIKEVSKGTTDTGLMVSVEDGIIIPGLINSHDHLLGTYFPKVGKGPYENWLPWDNDLKSSPIYQERQQIENRDLYLLGGYRNLLSGVTTVSDHIPHFVGDPFYDILPMKAIKDFALAHSVAPFALAWGDGINEEYQKAIKKDIPFITHIAEGFDAETVNDLRAIEKAGGLGENSVFVHGIAFSESDMKLIKARNANVVWCGDSNVFMFNETTNIRMLMNMGINVCIGTDSPMSGGLNLLTEMKFDKELYETIYSEELSDEKIYKMVSENPKKAFRMKDTGELKEGMLADITVVRNKGQGTAHSVVNAELADIMLVVIDGKPAYGDDDFADLFESLSIDYQRVTVDGVDKVVVGDLVGLLKRISKSVGFKKEFPFLPVEFEM
jgi:5-methylthioadenosine/S-adenosylhomocysteine deaminase